MTKTRATRSDFVQYRHLTTRWQDNDVYGHMNNVVYYELVDSVVNSWLRNEAGMPVPDGDIVGLVVQSGCTYHASLGWPEPIEAGMAVARVGNSSITYLIGLFLLARMTPPPKQASRMSMSTRTRAAPYLFRTTFVQQRQRFSAKSNRLSIGRSKFSPLSRSCSKEYARAASF